METTSNHLNWALKHKRLGTELKLINGRYYLYGVKSVYDKTLKRSRKVSLGILGSISREKGFIPSEKAELKKKSGNTYLYDALSLEPLYYCLLPGNIREVSDMHNTIKISGMEEYVFIADKGFFSESNIGELEKLSMQYIIPLRRDNRLIPYGALDKVGQSENYSNFSKRFIFHADTPDTGGRKLDLFLDGKLREQEKTDYLTRIQSLPESFSKPEFNEKLQSMRTLAVMHNTPLNPKDLYVEYKSRGEIGQFLDYFKNTIDTSCSHMRREESLEGWMLVNHISMMMIMYKLFGILKITPLNKKQMLIHRYSINDAVEHLKSIKQIKFAPGESVISEMNKSTKTLLKQMKISIT